MPASGVVNDESCQEDNLELEPGLMEQCLVDPDHGQAKNRRQDSTKRHNDEQPALHRHEPGLVLIDVCLSVINEQSWQIKKPCKPRHHEGDVQRFNP